MFKLTIYKRFWRNMEQRTLYKTIELPFPPICHGLMILDEEGDTLCIINTSHLFFDPKENEFGLNIEKDDDNALQIIKELLELGWAEL